MGRTDKVVPGPDPTKRQYADSDIMNMFMVAQRFGVQVNTVHMWRKRPSSKFPPPDIQLPAEKGSPIPLWYWRTVRKWAIAHRPKYL